MISFFQRRLQSFKFAGRGFIIFFSTQPNAWLHALATALVLVTSIYFSITRLEWIMITIAIGIVWIAESFNTALEFLADEVSQEQKELIGKAKDLAACGVLLSAICALVIGIFVFQPYL